jgi:hypothetical protein
VEYGSQMLSLGGVNHLTGGSKSEGRVTCETLLALCNGKPAELCIEGGATVIVQAGQPPIVNGVREERMRVGCGSATIGMFAKQWHGKVDEVVVVDDHITGVLSEHRAGKFLGIADTGIKMKGRRSTPGRYFQVADPGTGWGGTNICEPLSILGPFNPEKAWAGLRLLMVSTTGEHFAYYELDQALVPVERTLPGSSSRSASCRTQGRKTTIFAWTCHNRKLRRLRWLRARRATTWSWFAHMTGSTISPRRRP